jgi:hypothetical protein
MFKHDRDGVLEQQNRFETSQSDPFAAPRLRLRSGTFGLTAESGLNGFEAHGHILSQCNRYPPE